MRLGQHGAHGACGDAGIDQVVDDQQTRALGMIQRRPGSELGLVGLPLSFDGIRPPFAKAAPGLGEDNDSKLG